MTKRVALFFAPSPVGGGVARVMITLASVFKDRAALQSLARQLGIASALDLATLDASPDRDSLRARAAEFSAEHAVERYLEVCWGREAHILI